MSHLFLLVNIIEKRFFFFFFFLLKEHLESWNLAPRISKEVLCSQAGRDFESSGLARHLCSAQTFIGCVLSRAAPFLIVLHWFLWCCTAAPAPTLLVRLHRVAVVVPWMAGEGLQLALRQSSADRLLHRDLDCGVQALS